MAIANGLYILLWIDDKNSRINVWLALLYTIDAI
jgi:hypothetical protein